MEGIEFEARINGTLEQGSSLEVIRAKIAHMAQNIGNISLTEVTIEQITEELDARVGLTGWMPEPCSLHWRLLSAIDREPNQNSRQLTAVLNYRHESAISRAGTRLLEEGYVTKQKAGRMALWETTSLGASYLTDQRSKWSCLHERG